jgi:hypothetical protein
VPAGQHAENYANEEEEEEDEEEEAAPNGEPRGREKEPVAA